MTKQEKMRVQIARDVLDQLNDQSIMATRGSYCVLVEPVSDEQYEANLDFSSILEKQKHCQVCALGALFVAKALRYDKLPVQSLGKEIRNDIIIDREFWPYLTETFDGEQLRFIEMAFEGNNDRGFAANVGKEEKAYAFFDAYESSTERLTAIMENIIENNGLFVL